MYIVFTKLKDAQQYQKDALACWHECHKDDLYILQTYKWGEVIQRESDGAFLVIVCDMMDNSQYIIEEYDVPGENV